MGGTQQCALNSKLLQELVTPEPIHTGEGVRRMCFPLRHLDSKWQGYDVLIIITDNYYHRFEKVAVPCCPGSPFNVFFLLPATTVYKMSTSQNLRVFGRRAWRTGRESKVEFPQMQSISPLKTNCYKVPSWIIVQLWAQSPAPTFKELSASVTSKPGQWGSGVDRDRWLCGPAGLVKSMNARFSDKLHLKA